VYNGKKVVLTITQFWGCKKLGKKKTVKDYKQALVLLYNEIEYSQSLKEVKQLVKERIEQLTGESLSPKTVVEPAKPPVRTITPSLISVIVPILDDEPLYLTRCLNSLLEQTYRHLNIVLVSHDSTTTLEEYERKDSRVRLVRNPKSDLSSSLNLGLEDVLSTGSEYIGFCNSHDWVNPLFYETLLQNQITYGADIAQCGTYLSFDLTESNEKSGGYYPYREKIVQALLQKRISSDLYLNLFKSYLFQNVRFITANNCDELIMWQLLSEITRGISRTEEELYHHSIKITLPTYESELKKCKFFLFRYYTITASCRSETDLYIRLCLNSLHSLQREYLALDIDDMKAKYPKIKEIFSKAYSLFPADLKNDRDLFKMVAKNNVEDDKSFRKMINSSIELQRTADTAKKENKEKMEIALQSEKEAMMRGEEPAEERHDLLSNNTLPSSPQDDFVHGGDADSTQSVVEKYFPKNG